MEESSIRVEIDANMLELKDDEAVVYMVDSKRLQFTAAVEISYLDKIIQGWSCEYIHESGNVNQKQISLLRQAVMDGEISQSQMIDILNGSTIGRPSAKMEQVIEELLSNY